MDAPSPVSLVIGLVVSLVLFRGLEFMKPRAQRTPLIRKGIATDLAYWFATPVLGHYVARVAAILAAIPLLLVVYGSLNKAIVDAGFGPLSRLPMWQQTVVAIVVADFLGYWNHRLLHANCRLWLFHALHHSPRVLDWLSASRVHPVAEALSRIVIALPMIALGLSPLAVVSVGPLFALYGMLLHANLDWDWGPFRTVIASPRFHRWHHSDCPKARGRNLAGIFPLWDILFGTYYMPHDRIPDSFGAGMPIPESLLGQFTFPFRRRS